MSHLDFSGVNCNLICGEVTWSRIGDYSMCDQKNSDVNEFYLFQGDDQVNPDNMERMKRLEARCFCVVVADCNLYNVCVHFRYAQCS